LPIDSDSYQIRSLLSNLNTNLNNLDRNIVQFNDKSEKYSSSIRKLTRVMLIVAIVNAILVGCQIFLTYHPPNG